MSLEYEIINNGIHRNIEIIVEKQSGFYNLTKAGEMVQRIMGKDLSPGTCPIDWAVLDNTKNYKKLVAKVKNLSEDSLQFTVQDGDVKYRGIYAHELLYDHFLQWLSPEYALLVSISLKTKRKEENSRLLNIADSKQGDELAKTYTGLVKKVNVLRNKSEENDSSHQIILENANTSKQVIESMLDLRRSNKEFVDSYKELSDSYKELSDSTRKLVNSHEKLYNAAIKLKEQNKDLIEKVNELEETVEDLEDDVYNLQETVDKLEDTVYELEDTIDELRGTDDDINETIDESQVA